jgi:hypothetical protein
MRNRILFILTLLCCLFLATTLSAQATGTWVSGVGDDANPCSRTAPCKTFGGAISKTAACGEIRVLDPGGFGTVTITKSITIDGTGTLASILNSGGITGILVNVQAGDVCGTVILRNLSVNGGSATGSFGGAGVRVLNAVATSVHLEHMNISHQLRGVQVDTTIANNRLFMKDVDIRHTTTDGINIQPTAGQLVRIHLQDVRSRQSAGSGLRLANNVQGTVNNSQFEGNANGVNVVANSVFLTLNETVMSNNTGSGLINGSTATTIIDGCTISGNIVNGILNNTGGSVVGFGNNGIAFNGTDVNGTAVTTAAHP